MSRLANPNRFLRLAGRLQPWLALLAVALIAGGWIWGLFLAPVDAQQGGALMRIIYVHVPSAYVALGGYLFVAACSAAALIWKAPLGDILAKAASPVGAAFALLTLVTGAIWGKPAWGTWWEWDARLTSMLILFFFYVGHMALLSAFDDPTRGARAAAVLALVGVVNLPIIKFSVDWWFTLHQSASIFRLSGPSIHPAMLAPLLTVILGFTCYFAALLFLRARAEINGRKIAARRIAMLGD